MNHRNHAFEANLEYATAIKNYSDNPEKLQEIIKIFQQHIGYLPIRALKKITFDLVALNNEKGEEEKK